MKKGLFLGLVSGIICFVLCLIVMFFIPTYDIWFAVGLSCVLFVGNFLFYTIIEILDKK